ncbi:MAG: DEAD/DEAH box helicase, partial [Erysipelotrichaceae bacterium]|nr:DEAD/DEAH box helicase [Erysipelotrichaceae bacterium]
MRLANVWLEHPTMMLNRTFSYILKDDQHPQRGCRVQVELNNRMIVGFVDSVEESDLSREEYEKQAGFSLKYVYNVMDENPVLNDELYQLGLWMASDTVSPVISCFQAMLPSKMKPVSNRQKAVMETYVHLEDASLASTLKQKQAVVLLEEKDLLRSDFRKLAGSAYDSLLKKNAISTYEVEREAGYEELTIREADYPLTDKQKEAIDKIRNSDKDVILLHGLTGSGKTEIYMQLAAEKCRNDQQVLIMVPEISLTPQMVRRMTDRFGGNIAIYHSHLNNQERYEQYQLVRNNKVKIVVGTRSAIFMPFSNLGMIVLDEEHDFSYKQ